MPILYIHGVNVRDRSGFLALKPYLERLVAPAISDDPNGVVIDDVFWGDIAVKFAWDGASRPRTRLLGMGSAAEKSQATVFGAEAFASALAGIPKPAAASGGGLVSGRATATAGPNPVRLRELAPDDLSNLLSALIESNVADQAARPRLSLAADAVATDPATAGALATATTVDQELAILLRRVEAKAAADAALVGMGPAAALKGVWDRLQETVSRAADWPAYAVSVAAAELRPKLNDMVSIFIGDVFHYLAARGDSRQPGEIQTRLLDRLRTLDRKRAERNGEPLVVLSHSMGGQIVYDCITSFLPGIADLKSLKVDFWCATASQVGFFEEAKLFLLRDPQYRTGNPVPFPHSNLKAWWNVWDPNDFLSFTVRKIIDDVDDEAFDSGLPLLGAHSGYLQRPSFYRRFADKIRAARGTR